MLDAGGRIFADSRERRNGSTSVAARQSAWVFSE